MAKIINKFFGGITRDEKSKNPGVCSNVEEIDILENQDYIRAAQIMSADSMPSSTEIFSHTVDSSDTVFGYGRETSGSKVRIVSVASGGGTAPSSFSTLFTAASVLYYDMSPIEYQLCKTGDANRLYWLSKNGSTISLNHCTTSGTNETSDGTLTGLDGTNDRLFMRRIYGELHIGNGQYIARIDKDGVFTEKAWTAPNGWEVVDICEAGNSGLVLARNVNVKSNVTKGFFWDLSSLTQFDDSFDIPFGGPQWVIKHRETIKIFCAINGEGRFYQVSAFAGGVPAQLKGIVMSNLAIEVSGTPVSSQRMVSVKDDIIYFGVNKTDKTAIYAIGQLDTDKNYALYLAKRFNSSSSYATHTSCGLFIQGPNFYASYSDNGTASNSRCMSLNSPTRSSNAIYETIVIDEDNSTTLKKIDEIFVTTRPIPASTSVNAYINPDYSSYTQLKLGDRTSTSPATGTTIGTFMPLSSSVKTFKIKIQLLSNGSTSPYVTGLGWSLTQQGSTARK